MGITTAGSPFPNRAPSIKLGLSFSVGPTPKDAMRFPPHDIVVVGGGVVVGADVEVFGTVSFVGAAVVAPTTTGSAVVGAAVVEVEEVT
jgi:hypothetical protein